MHAPGEPLLHPAARRASSRSTGLDIASFRAARNTRGTGGDPDAWRAVCDGNLTAYDVGCGHYEMTAPGPLEFLAGVLMGRERRP